MVDIPTSNTARDGELSSKLNVDEAAYDAWFRRKVQETLDDPRPAIPDEQATAHFAKRRTAALTKPEQDET